jgi:hypothetical protein
MERAGDGAGARAGRCFSAAALPLLLLVGLTSATAVTLAAGVLTASLPVVLLSRDRGRKSGRPTVPTWVYALAGLAACAPAVAVMPKFVADGVILAAPAFDHSKVAIIDEIARLGLPPGNPAFGEAGQPSRLAYYYLWHFSAATLALVAGASGWEADVALTWFAAFSSLLLMTGMAVWLGGRAAAFWTIPLSLAGSLRPILDAALGPERRAACSPPTPGWADGWCRRAGPPSTSPRPAASSWRPSCSPAWRRPGTGGSSPSWPSLSRRASGARPGSAA